MYKIKEIEDGKILNFRSLKMKDVVELCKDINQFFKDGYQIKEDPTTKQCPKIPMLFNLRFEKGAEGVEEVEVDNKPNELDTLTKTDDLLKFAEDNDTEVPEEITHPMSIKKFIKENL